MQPPQAYEVDLRVRGLLAALQGNGISILHENLERKYDLAENLHTDWPAQAIIGKADAELYEEPLCRQMSDAKAGILAGGEPCSIEVDTRNSATGRLFAAHFSPDCDAAGVVIGVFTVVTDITDHSDRDRAMTTLLRDVSHRSKNLLAIVQSVAMQTAHHSDGIDAFLQKFRGRLHALASTQDLVTESNWRGTRLHRLIAAQFARLSHAAMESITVLGDDPMVGPNAALHIGLAVHELTANSILYGALSAEGAGKIVIRSAIERSEGSAELTIAWHETSRQVADEGANRFGTLVLERIVPLSVDGRARYVVGTGHVDYSVTIPAAQFED